MIRTNEPDKRDSNGRFTQGNSGGPGRPPIVKEHEYLETLGTTCTVNDWQEICQRAIKDAKAGDHRARDWLSKYLLPTNPSIADENEGDHEVIDISNVSSDDIINAMVALDRLKGSMAGGNSGV